jgi:hypothetical protein
MLVRFAIALALLLLSSTLGRADEALAPPAGQDCYVEGYLQAAVDAYFQEYRVRVYVRGHTAYLYHMPVNRQLSCWIHRFVASFPYIDTVVVCDRCSGPPVLPQCKPLGRVGGVWFPQENKLFQPLVADPRQITYSAAWRFHDRIAHGGVSAVSFGNSFPLFRWIGITPWCCDAQIDLEGGVWAIFRLDRHLRDHHQREKIGLLNSDYYVALVATALCDNWSYRFRFYHISSHLGDEFMCAYPAFRRLNPSREAVDLFASYQLSYALRLYGGAGVNTRSNESFRIRPFYIEYGTEVRVFGWPSWSLCLFFQPFLAMHFRNWQYMNWNFDATYAAGFEISGFEGMRRKVRAFLEYHDGYSVEGQFAKLRTKYLALRVSWGF